MRVPFRLCVFVCALSLCGLSVGSQAATEQRTLTYRHFHVIDSEGQVAVIESIAVEKTPLWARDVSQKHHDWSDGPEQDRPCSAGPIPFVVPPPEGSGKPFHAHNHQPDITWLPNGDLFAVWYSTARESGTELTVLAIRLRAGNTSWDPAHEFFKAENRNMHGNSVSYDGQGTVHHLNGMGQEGATGWGRLALLHRYRDDNGVTRGIHAGVVELQDGRLMALGRGQVIGGYMPMSLSDDMGPTWTYSASPFPPIGDGQRLVLMRLREGPLLFVSFASDDRSKPQSRGMIFTDREGNEFIGYAPDGLCTRSRTNPLPSCPYPRRFNAAIASMACTNTFRDGSITSPFS